MDRSYLTVNPTRGQQLELTWRDATALARELQDLLGEPVQVIITDNTSSLIAFRRVPGVGARLRLHHMFLQAPSTVIHALAKWVVSPRRSTSAGIIVDDYIRAHSAMIRKKPGRLPTLMTRGQCYDLQKLFDEVNAEQFQGKVSAFITWGKRPKRGRRGSIRFGSYTERLRLIRIHPALDSPRVPLYFVRYIVFHEMLHAFLGVSAFSGRNRRVHTREFRRREAQYPDYKKAILWQNNREHLRFLLTG